MDPNVVQAIGACMFSGGIAIFFLMICISSYKHGKKMDALKREMEAEIAYFESELHRIEVMIAREQNGP